MKAFVILWWARKDENSPWHAMHSGVSKNAHCGHTISRNSRDTREPMGNICKLCLRSLHNDKNRFHVEDDEVLIGSLC